MKLLIADFLFVEAHKDMNINFINAIKQCADIDVVSLNGFYDMQRGDFQKSNIGLIDISLERKNGVLGTRIFSFELMRRTAFFVRQKSYDAVLCLGFDTTLFGLGMLWYRDKTLFLFHHKNIDELTNKVKMYLFGIYKNKVNHVVFETFFKDRLVKGIGVKADRVFVIPHPTKAIAGILTDKSYDCVGLCNSNDETFINDALQCIGDFEECGLRILLRSKTKQNSGGAVEVINGFLEREQYDELMAAGKTVFVPLPETYIYRLSGSIYDALSRGKIVFTTSKYYVEDYERRYPGTCYYVNSLEQLIIGLKEHKGFSLETSFQNFLEEHSIQTVARKVKNMLTSVLRN